MSKLSFEVKMNLVQLLDQRKVKILNQATDASARSHLAHYDAVSIERNQAWLHQLYDIMVQKGVLFIPNKVRDEEFVAG